MSGSKPSIAFEKKRNDQWNFLLKLQGIEQDGFDIHMVHFYLHMYQEKTDSSLYISLICYIIANSLQN